MTRTRVALVFGGASSEHDVSCLTAGGVARAIDTDRFEIVGIGITKEGRWVQVPTEEITAMTVVEGVLPTLNPDRPSATLLAAPAGGRVATLDGDTLVDAHDFEVAFALLHGPFGEDGTIQGLFEMLAIPYVGSGVAASANGMDKDLMKRSLVASGLPSCRFVTLTARQWREEPERCVERVKALPLPVFVKPARGGSSVGITKVSSWDDLGAAVGEAQRWDPKVIVEEGIEGGREIEFAVLGGRGGAPRVSQPGEIVMAEPGTFYDFESKYVADDRAILKVPTALEGHLGRRAADVASRTFEAMGAEGLARVDLFVTLDGRVLVNEINTMPGFTHISMFPSLWAASGLDYRSLITDLIEQALERPAGLR